MSAERLAILVEELGLRSLQRPGELRPVTLAGVDLFPLRVDLEKKFFVGWRLELLRNLLGDNRERKAGTRYGEQRDRCE